MRWYELRSQHLSDEEYIERVRKNLRIMDRYRPWIIAGYVVFIFVVMAMFVIPIMIKSIHLMVEFQPSGGATWPVVSGFLSGIGLGFVFMTIAYMPLIALLLSLMPMRTDRLLIRYYDAHQHMETSITGDAGDKQLPSTPS